MERSHDCPALARAYCAASRLEIMSEANDPASAATDPGHGPNNPCEENVMDNVADNTPSAAPATPTIKTLCSRVGEIEYALTDAVSMAEIVSVLAEDHIDFGSGTAVLDPARAESLIFAINQAIFMVRKAYEAWERANSLAYAMERAA